MGLLFCGWQGLVFHRNPGVALFRIHAHMANTWKGQMHACHQQLAAGRFFHTLEPGCNGQLPIHVNGD